ncbi:MAG TPA: hypothetical protein VF199_04390, partial [Bacillales bacterium]
DYFQDPEGYEPWESWEQALKKIGGEESYPALMRFAENSLQSCLNQSNAVTLKQLADDALDSLSQGEQVSNNDKLDRLYQYLDELDEAGYFIKNRMSCYALRNNLIPWIVLLESWAWAGRRAIEVLRAAEAGQDIETPVKWLKESSEEVENHQKRITGNALAPLIQYTFEKVKELKKTTT